MTLLQSLLKSKKSPEHDLTTLTESLRSTLGERLKSVIVFGSMATGDFHPDHSDVNVLIVADLSCESLQPMATALRPWFKKGHEAPVLVAPEHLAGFARAFPIEFLDMLDQHRLLFGEDPLKPLTVDRRHLRAQCEHDLALTQLKLRQAVVVASGRTERLRQILIQSLPSVLTLFRAVVWLEENTAKLDKIKSAEHLAGRLGFQMPVLHRLHDLRFRRSADNLTDLTCQYLEVIEVVLQHLRR